jgi:sirohydrochlorin ferrochelatase
MTEHPELSKDEQQVLLRSLIEIGSSKPVGYLPLYTIQEFLHLTPEAVISTETVMRLTDPGRIGDDSTRTALSQASQTSTSCDV